MGKYEELIERVYDKLDRKKQYLDEEKYYDFFVNNTEYERLEEHNLWTYWQGRGVRNPKIMVVGQDWGSIEQSRKYYEYIKMNQEARIVCFEQIKKEFPECKDSDFKTDEELVELMQILGYERIYEVDYKDLYFTNLIPGYRNSTASTGKASEVKKGISQGVLKDFRELLEILRPKVIICLGRLVSESIAKEFHGKKVIKGAYNKFLDEELSKEAPKPIMLDLENGDQVYMFAIAHLGKLGRNNRKNNFKNEEMKEKYPKADWEVIAAYIDDLNLS